MYLDFNIYSDEELKKRSILIKNKYELIDNTTSYTLEPQLPCKQCKLIMECQGHTGRIPLYYKIVHPLFVSILCKEITHICPICKKYNNLLSIKDYCCNKRITLATFALRKIKHNESPSDKPKYSKKYNNKTFSEYCFTFGDQILSIDQMYEEIGTADFSDNPKLQNQLLNVFIKNIPVLPINMRPSIIDSNNVTIHSNITTLYNRLLDLNNQYQNKNIYLTQSAYILRSFNLYKKILGIRSTNDSVEDINKNYIKQMLSGKTGIFRNMCLAKRQNFCLRSVIVPNIDTPLDVVLIPKTFTDKLIAYGYKPNDYVIINRQPTLQTTSILSVHSYPSNSRAIQINPLIVNVFQGDFDGDEMNIFWLPGEEAKKEMAIKLNLANNIRSFKNASIMIKFIQDTLTGIYNMTRDKNIIDPIIVERICNKLKISNKKWLNFCQYYESRMNSQNIPYAHLLSLLLPKTLTLYDKNNLIVDKGILLGIINGDNQTILLNGILNYGNKFYLKFMWDVQRMVHEYNLSHIISISIADCLANDELKKSFLPIVESIPKEMYSVSVLNIDVAIANQHKSINQNNLINQALSKYYSLTKLVDSIDNNLTNIINSGSKGNKDNVIQILMSVGIQAALPTCYIKNSYSEGLSAKELFLHSKSGRAGIISTSLNTSSSGYLQRELVKSMEDLVTDEQGIVRNYVNEKIYYYPFSTNSPDIDNTFLEYAFSMSNI